MKTVTIQIGNSDNKLTQGQWSNFAAAMNLAVRMSVYRVHFKGGSDWDAPWQNACWVCEVRDDQMESLQAAITTCRANYEQESAAVTFGETVYI